MTRQSVLTRRLVALGAASLVSLVAAGCGASLDDAATVTLSTGDGGEKTVTHISRDDLEDDLRILRANEGFVAFLEQNGLEVPESESSIGSQVTALWLSDLVNQVVMDAELDARDVEVDDTDREAVRDQIAESYGGADVFEEFPKEFRDDIVERAARWNALLTRGGGEVVPPTEDDARAFYEENADQLGACPSGRTVAHILLETEAEAAAVKADLDAGADFAATAVERSIDPTAADNSGDLGCLQDGAFVAPFEEAAKAAVIGEPTAPVKTDFGFHVILASEFAAPTFAELKSQILDYLVTQAEQEAGTEVNAVVQERLAAAEVDIDPRYGTWVADDDQGPRVVEPDAPEPADGRDQPATTVDPLGAVPAPGG